ncbi:non-ribosomal peptide synthase/polyketide synthase [Pseudomonas sp. PICF141]|uniref:non-ribosomal peptide synthase/polyketide synthase n=1 Tax=Pseudomonas sp. PICF141 TaxID=1949067 RepID=UPI000BAB6973|nr:non-ribosomal peptide synthase/polyketide synthase [Pseudomonas sp. PICF141]PAU57235.1 non-ribosomal peptide synthetase [Pseudomonas sp. PICF141]
MQELIESVGQLSAKQRKALAVLLKQKGVNLFEIAPVFKRTAEEPLLLSYAQQRQWFLWQWAPHSAAYNIPTALRLQGPLDVAALQRSVQALIERHETLRTVFTQDAGHPLQTILPAGSFALDIHTLSPELAANPQASIQAFVQTQSQQAFDLQTGPLLRAALLQVAPQDHVLVLTLHHIVSDGWSLQVMIEELVQLYAGFNLGHDAGLPALPIQYADYALWQRQWMEAGEQERQLAYWQHKLGGEQPVLELPTDRPRPVEQSFAGASHNLILDPTLSDSLKAFARRENVTLFVLLLASFQALLHRYSGQADIRVGVPVANRGRVEIERLIGFFVNTQVLKADVDGQASFIDLLRQVRQTAQEVQAHQDLPFEQLVEALEPGRSLSHSPLFQVMFNHQAESRISLETRLNGLSIEPLEWQSATAQFDLVLNTTEQAHGIEAVLKYATDLFEASTIERLAQHWRNLLQAIVQDPPQRIAQLPVLDDAQQQQLLAHWNPSPVMHPVSQCIHQLIEVQAERHPQAPAVVFAGQRLTYAELNQQANQWAHQLIARGVGPDVRVGVAVERSLDMIVAIVAVLKAGGAYVPLDPSYPDDRLRYMIEDSGIELLLTQGHLRAQLPIPPGLACLDLNQPPPDSSTANPPCRTTADNLAYVIYTSGSTGKPKGALLPHGNVIRLFSATDHWFGFGPEDSWTLFHSYAFDFSVWEIFGALLHGGKLVVVPHDVTRSPEEFYTLLCDEQVTVLNQTPSAFKPLMQVASASSRNHALRYVVFGGEALEVQSLRPWFERFGDRAPTLINMYGITETTVHVTYRPLSMADLQHSHSSPIGAPIVDLSWYLLDEALNLVPQGCIGELYIAGAGLARGYLNQPGMSATRFVPDPFNAVAGERLYRTGDLARLRGDGVVEYIGRIDHQVKIRGFRIELGEIETRLLKHDAVREAVVLAVDGLSGQQLAAWIVPSEPLDAEAHGGLRDSIKAQLRESLPDYMVPVSWAFLERLPLTANGKLDRKQLPNPDVSLVQEAYAAPRSELEQRLAEIWQDVLKVERVGLNDNFFELGGDSIISIQVVSRARQAGIRFSPKDIFQHQTVQRLATVAQQSDAVQAMQGDVLGAAVLTPIQQYFFATDIPQRQHWNQSILLTPAEPLQAAALEQALEHLQRHHDALRLRYRQTAGGWAQEHAAVDQPNALLRTVALADSEALPALCLELQRSLNLSDGPLIRAALVDLPDASQRLLLVIHHLVVDGVSWRILLEDLQTAYQQLSAGSPLRLPAKTTAFKDWGERLQGHARSAGLETELNYWREQLAEAPADLPLDNPDGQLQNRFERSVDTRLDAERTRQLLQQAPAVYRTQVNDLLLTALARVLCEWTASDSALVQLEGHGREDLFDDLDLSRTVGWFTSMFPVRLTPQASLEASIKGIKEQLRSIPNKGIGYGLLRYLGSDAAQAALSGVSQPKVTFNYLGQFDNNFDEGALWVPATEDKGAGQDEQAPMSNWLTIDGRVYQGQLSLTWTYSADVFEEATINALARAYEVALGELIEHCLSHPSGGLTPSDVPLAGLSQAHLDSLPIAAQRIEDIYPLAPMQQGILFHSLYDADASAYVYQMLLDIDGLDVPRFQQAWQRVVDRHEVLRAGFIWGRDGLDTPLQVIYRQLTLEMPEVDVRAEPDLQTVLEARALADRERGFDLQNPPLLRLCLLRTDDDRHRLIFTCHHILMDGWSNSRMFGEVLQDYAGHPVPSAQGRYRDFLAWLQRQDKDAAQAFWCGQLAELDEPTRLASACHGQTAPGPGKGVHKLTFDAAFTQRLNGFSRQQQVTLNSLVQAAWLLVLQRYTGQSSVAFGATVSGRPVDLPGIEQQLGLFINTLPVIASPQATCSVRDWVRSVQDKNLLLRDYEQTPLQDIQRLAALNGEALFDTLLVFENYPVSDTLEANPGGLRFSGLEHREQTNYGLTLIAGAGEVLSLDFNYLTEHFAERSIVGLARHLEEVLRQFLDAPQRLLGEIGLLPASELRTLARWNDHHAAYPTQALIHQGFEAQVEARPQAIALRHAGAELTYAELNRRANQLARHLQTLGVGAEIRVGVAMPRSAELVIALMAVLKAGGTYVPLDPDYPADRVAYMLDDSQARVLLTQQHLLSQLPETQAQVVWVEAGGQAFADLAPLNLEPRIDSANLAYVIYTSGSTGKPKGVAIAHRNVQALIHWSHEVYSEEDLQGVLASTSVCFDLSVWEIFVTLVRGGSIIMARNALELPELPERDQVRLINTVPSAIAALQRAGQVPQGVRIINLAGEPLKQALVDTLYRETSVEHVYDLYGPSEDTTYSTCTRREAGGQANIGRPLVNTTAHVLDAQLQAAPIGVAAELYLAGDGITRGYLFRPGLTAERFVPNPLASNGERMYRTGDLTRLREDGVIEYVGRIDHQVKVRGFRIELGEIEARLLAHDSVREGVVLAVEGHSGQQLVAYVVPTQSDLSPQQQDDLSEALKAGLKAHLPDYMVPAQWLFIEQLPLTPNGKLDRKALPTPDTNPLQRNYVAPRTALEQQIAGVWQDILKLERVGVTDNFFTLGGDSIISIQVVSRARQQGISFTPKDLFQQQTVQGLATVAQLGKALAPIDQGPVTGETPLLPIQQWFFEQPLPQRHHWNQSVLLKPLNPLLAATLEQALHALIDHHDGLRLGFTQTPGGWSASYRTVEQQRLSPLWLESVRDAAHLERVAEQAQRSLDLQQGPLLRAVLFSLPEGEQRLLLIVHHLVVDGVSWRILLEDLQGSYRQLLAGEPLALAAKTTSFKQWAEQLQTHARSESLLGQLPYWQAQCPDGASLPQDNPQGSLQSRHALTLYSRLNPTLTRRLLQQTPAAYRTQVNDLLLTALARVIARWSEQSSVLIQLEGHGREDLFDGLDLTRTVGWFTSLFPVKLTPTQELAGSIKQIKEQLRAIPDRGIGYGVLRYLGDEACQASLRILPTPRITFNYLGQFDGSFDSQSGALFVPADEGKGAEHSDDALLGNWLTLNGQVYGGELSVGWSFSTHMFNASTIERLAEEYARELELLIEHCCQPDSHGVTPSDFPLAHLDQARLDALPIAPSRIEDIYPLSPMQEGMLFHTLSDNGSSLYVNQISLPVGGLDVERFRKAWEAVIERQAILRTSFHWHDGLAKPLQIVQRQATLDLQVLDWRDRDASEADIAARAAEDRARGFELTQAPLQRVLLIRSTEDQYQMVWTSHHILMDGWSSSRLFGEVIQHYAKGEISAENGRYRDFIAWLQAQDQDARELFWKARLAPVNEATALSQAIHPRHVSDEPGHNAIYSHWDAQQTGRLLQFCRDLRITPNTLIQGAWLLLLQRYTGKNTVTFGATVSGRPESLPNVGNMLGLFINTLPIIQTLEPDQPLADWLNRLQAYNLDIRDHSQAPLADVQRWSGLGGQALFDSIIVFENYPIDDRLQEDNDSGLSFGKSIGHDVTNVPMDLAVTLGDELSIEYLYLRSHFSAEAVEGIRLTLENTLEAMMRAPDERLGNLQRLSLEQWQAMQTWSAEPPADHQPQLLPELISRHALTQPEAIAVQCAGLSLSYGELERRANRLAHCLIEHGAGPEVVIGVALPRSLEMVVSFLAVLKSGAAYVPLDIDYPPERLAYMIEDSGMALLLTQSSLRATLPAPEGLLRLELDQLDESRYADEAPVYRVLEQGLAYLVYTSGSTGRPKGVAVTQGPLSMHCQAIAKLYEMDPRSCELHFMSFAFDGAHERWLSTLYSGGRLVVRDGCLWTPEQTYRALHEYGVTIACFPPAYLKQLAEYAAASAIAPPPVRIYCFGGDAVPDQTFEQVKAALRPEYFTNGYGPTETVVTPMLWKVPVSARCEAAYAPIGRAVGARSLYVLDEELNPLPPGFAGELYIGGYGVARGYHGRPDLTCERFVPNPFASGERMYRTGDLVRLRQDGVVDYVGRIDHQVKVRGFRIELGEVEASLRQLAQVRDALVIARDNASGKQLIGYVVTDAGQQLGDELKAALRSTLPEYMVPAQIVCLSAFPVTPNGKLDRKALPEPEFKSEEYIAPRNQQEHLLADIWAQVLQVEQVGISDNFFELGGDSILSLQVISRVRNHPTLQMELKLRDLMRYQTIAGIVEQNVVQASTAQPAADLTHVASEGLFNLLPIQEWFFAEGMAESHHYNQSFLLSARQVLDLDALEQALGWIENHHDSLRLRFCQEGGRWLQRYAAPTERREPMLWRREAENSEQVEALANLAQRSLKLDDGPAWRVVHIALPDGQARLLMVIHHLVVDTVSWRILLDDLKVAYEACVMGIEPQLPIRTSSYRAFAEALQAQAPVIAEQELAYWLEQLDQPGIDLPCDNRRGKNQVRHQAQARLKLSRELTEQLLKQAPAVYRTQINDLLLSALSRALCRWSEQQSALILLEGHGREDLFENIDLSRSLGWFTSMFPVRLTPDNTDIGASIVNVRAQLAAIPQKGIGYGVLRHLAGPQRARQLADLPQARVTFNYLGQFDQSFDEQALLVPALEESGDNYSLQANLGNWLEVVGQVYDGQLALRCIYSSQRYRASTVERLMQDYQRELEALIEHCMARVG